MSPWSIFPFVRITLALVGGILAARAWAGPSGLAAGLLGLLLLTYVLIVVGTPLTRFRAWRPWLGLLGLGCIFLLGYLRWLTNEVCHDPKHLTQWAASIEAYEAVALEDAHEKAPCNSVVVALRRARVQGKWKQVKGKVRVSFPQATALQVGYGDVLLIRGAPQAMAAARNPNEFDYAAFLRLAQVYYQHFIAGGGIAVVAHQPPNPIQALSFQVLRHCQSLLTQRIHDPEVRAVVLALVLGQKDTLTAEMRVAYTGAGTMHVLAVSGLHVGMLYWFVSLLLALLKSIQNAQWLSPLVSLVVLWFYAFVTGLSPSVLRATTMFTFVALAPMLGRQTNIYNTLAASAFLLLWWDPMLLFAVGFQLSYLAVLGIVYLQPRIYSWLAFNNLILDKLWLLASVSLGAQLATAPLSLYYFHQFPTYFLIANWGVVPAALVILFLGLVVLVASFWPGLSASMAWLLEKVVVCVNAFVGGIQKLPYSLLDPIVLSAPAVLLLYGLLVLGLVFLHTRRLQYLVATSVLAMLLSWRAIQVGCSQQAQCQVIFYGIDRHRVVAFVKGRQSILCVDARFKDAPQKYSYHVQPSQTALGIVSSVSYTLEEAVQQPDFPLQTWQGLKVAVWQGKQFVFIDQRNRNLPRLAPKLSIDFLVVEENAVATLQPLLDRFAFSTLVIGASNQRSLAQQLQTEATQHGIHSHSLLQQGALTVSW